MPSDFLRHINIMTDAKNNAQSNKDLLSKPDAADARAAALRENLKKRKAQKKDRASEHEEDK